MNKKKVFLISLILFLGLVIGGGFYYYFVMEDKFTTLTIAEKEWIEDNKNNIIDISLPTNIPIFSYEGGGVFFDFLSDIEKMTGLEFNKLSYNLSNDPTSPYAFVKKDKKEENDILIYEDNYVLITKENVKYTQLSDIPVMTVGVLDQNLDVSHQYLRENGGITLQEFRDIASLTQAFETDKVQGILLPKTLYIDQILQNEGYYISYQLTEMVNEYVLRLGENKKLNTILKKYFTKWAKDKYTDVFNKHFATNYFAFNEIYESDIALFRGKRYTYGFVSHAPYDALDKGNLIGINSEIIKNFSKMSDIEITFSEYKSLSGLMNAFNENKVDFFLNVSSNKNYAIDVQETVDVFDEPVVVVSHMHNNITINSLASLISKTVNTLEDSKIAASLSNYDISIKTFGNMEDLLENSHEDSILVLDERTYAMYVRGKLSDYKVDYSYHLEDGYTYVCRDIHDNKIFNQFFNFYISFINEKQYANKVTYDMFLSLDDSTFAIYASFGLLLLGLTAILILLSKKKPTHNKIKKVRKEEKIKYIDQLTCLKNRNFLNDSMKHWDNSEIYPQTIIIIDLNNIAYVNDNYGHEEGDKVIIEAANVLIKNQVENSEIIRTDGNEFLIYLVAYDEKQIVSYIRKLTKELKEIAHGFGAALGYSMINDAIKTIDDAINEATLDMRNNKEEAQN